MHRLSLVLCCACATAAGSDGPGSEPRLDPLECSKLTSRGPESAQLIGLSPDGTQAYFHDGNRYLTVVPTSGAGGVTLPIATLFAVHPSGQLAVGLGIDRELWITAPNRELATLRGWRNARWARFDPTGSRLLVATLDKAATIDIASGNVESLPIELKLVLAVLEPGGRRLFGARLARRGVELLVLELPGGRTLAARTIETNDLNYWVQWREDGTLATLLGRQLWVLNDALEGGPVERRVEEFQLTPLGARPYVVSFEYLRSAGVRVLLSGTDGGTPVAIRKLATAYAGATPHLVSSPGGTVLLHEEAGALRDCSAFLAGLPPAAPLPPLAVSGEAAIAAVSAKRAEWSEQRQGIPMVGPAVTPQPAAMPQPALPEPSPEVQREGVAAKLQCVDHLLAGRLEPAQRACAEAAVKLPRDEKIPDRDALAALRKQLDALGAAAKGKTYEPTRVLRPYARFLGPRFYLQAWKKGSKVDGGEAYDVLANLLGAKPAAMAGGPVGFRFILPEAADLNAAMKDETRFEMEALARSVQALSAKGTPNVSEARRAQEEAVSHRFEAAGLSIALALVPPVTAACRAKQGKAPKDGRNLDVIVRAHGALRPISGTLEISASAEAIAVDLAANQVLGRTSLLYNYQTVGKDPRNLAQGRDEQKWEKAESERVVKQLVAGVPGVVSKALDEWKRKLEKGAP